MVIINENMKELPISCGICMYSILEIEGVYYDKYHYCCAMPKRDIIDDDLYHFNDKPSWCPLKEV